MSAEEVYRIEAELNGDLAKTFELLENLTEAKQHYQTSLDYKESCINKDQNSIAFSHRSLGYVCYLLNELDAALEHYQKSLQLNNDLKYFTGIIVWSFIFAYFLPIVALAN